MRKKTVKDDYQIKDTDSLVSLFGESKDRDHQNLKSNPVYQEFQKKFKTIHNIGRAHGCYEGETVGMIKIKYGKYMDEISFIDLDEVMSFIRINGEKKYALLHPKMHAYLLQIGYYEKSSTAIPNRGLLSGFLSTLTTMIENKSKPEDFLKLGEDIIKL